MDAKIEKLVANYSRRVDNIKNPNFLVEQSKSNVSSDIVKAANDQIDQTKPVLEKIQEHLNNEKIPSLLRDDLTEKFLQLVVSRTQELGAAYHNATFSRDEGLEIDVSQIRANGKERMKAIHEDFRCLEKYSACLPQIGEYRDKLLEAIKDLPESAKQLFTQEIEYQYELYTKNRKFASEHFQGKKDAEKEIEGFILNLGKCFLVSCCLRDVNRYFEKDKEHVSELARKIEASQANEATKDWLEKQIYSSDGLRYIKKSAINEYHNYSRLPFRKYFKQIGYGQPENFENWVGYCEQYTDYYKMLKLADEDNKVKGLVDTWGSLEEDFSQDIEEDEALQKEVSLLRKEFLQAIEITGAESGTGSFSAANDCIDKFRQMVENENQ